MKTAKIMVFLIQMTVMPIDHQQSNIYS